MSRTNIIPLHSFGRTEEVWVAARAIWKVRTDKAELQFGHLGKVDWDLSKTPQHVQVSVLDEAEAAVKAIAAAGLIAMPDSFTDEHVDRMAKCLHVVGQRHFDFPDWDDLSEPEQTAYRNSVHSYLSVVFNVLESKP